MTDEPTNPLVIRTLRDHQLYDTLHTWRAFCESYDHKRKQWCGHYALLDFDKLIAQFGEDFDLGELRYKLRCTVCGGRDCKISSSCTYGK